MWQPNSQARFLLRASAALLALSAVWWLILVNPLLLGFRHTADFVGSLAFGRAPCQTVTETPSGDWNICVPVSGVVSKASRPGHSRINSIEFEIGRSGPTVFTFALPVFWALVLARPDGGWLRRLAAGTALTALVELVIFVVFLRTYVFALQAQSNATPNPVTKWFFDFSFYVELNAAPVAAPFLVALGLHPALRNQILGFKAVRREAAAAHGQSARL